MRKILFILGIMFACIVVTGSSVVNNSSSSNVEIDDGWVYYTSVKAYYSETETTMLYIWYKDGNGVRVYGYVNSRYSNRSSTPAWNDEVEANRLFQSKEIDGFRRNYRYKAGSYFFNAELPNMKNNDVINDWHYYVDVTGWYSETEPVLLYVWYKETNGGRVYGYVNSSYNGQNSTPSWNDEIETNRLYQSKEISDFRSNYKYKAGMYYFNSTLPYKKNNDVINGWHYHSHVTGWYSETESTILFIWYKEGNGVRVYGYVNSSYGGQNSTPTWSDYVEVNDDYQSVECSDFRRDFRYKAGIYIFNADLPKMKR